MLSTYVYPDGDNPEREAREAASQVEGTVWDRSATLEMGLFDDNSARRGSARRAVSAPRGSRPPRSRRSTDDVDGKRRPRSWRRGTRATTRMSIPAATPHSAAALPPLPGLGDPPTTSTVNDVRGPGAAAPAQRRGCRSPTQLRTPPRHSRPPRSRRSTDDIDGKRRPRLNVATHHQQPQRGCRLPTQLRTPPLHSPHSPILRRLRPSQHHPHGAPAQRTPCTRRSR